MTAAPFADAIVVAAGTSTRMEGVDKLAADIGGRPLLAWTLHALAAAPEVEQILVVTTADRRTVTFTIGSAQYSAGGVIARSGFAPFIDGGEPIVPLYALAHALYVEPVAGAGETILQPQIGALETLP